MEVDNRNQDDKQEKILNAFLMEHFFNKIFTDAELVCNRDRQVQGMDVIADGKIIDIKAQSSPQYLNNPRPTFILELLFIDRSHKITTGWFLNPDVKTTTYAFIWVNSSAIEDGRIPYPEAIEELEVLLVDKPSLKKRINNYVTDKTLTKDAYEMLGRKETNRSLEVDGAHLSHSPQFREKPVNIVAQKWLLEQFSIGHYIVTKNSVSKIE